MPSPLIDTHAHLYFDRFDADRAEVIARARDAGITAVINVAIDLNTSMKTIDLAERYPGFCHASAGIHPTETAMTEEKLGESIRALRKMVEESADLVCAIGEIGLDYYWDKAPRDAQARAFHAQMRLAEELALPVIIHCRDAMPDTLAIVTEYAGRVHGVFHCFSGNAAEAAQALELGWYISFAGNVTYPKASGLKQVARGVPSTRLLLETDAPFLAPQAMRGKRNEPAFAIYTRDFLADLLRVSPDALGEETAKNARSLFSLAD